MWPCSSAFKLYLSVVVSVLLTYPSHAQVLGDIPNTDQSIRIDGKLDEPAWKSGLRIVLDVETRPGENIDPPVETEAWLIEDGRRLLVAFKAYDPDPDKIRAYLRDRDSAFSDDFVGVVLDTFNDERRAFEFFVNPLGAQMDLIQDDVNDNEDESWDAIWESAGEITDFGYVVEVAIPFTQLRFPKTEDKQTWGIDVLRFYPRVDRHRISNNKLD
ncbi:MAG: carbohydrate binding family 9 domain-containing protein, partial [Pseudomonadota bacterium]